MNINRKTILILSATLIAAVVSGCVQEISENGTPAATPQPNAMSTETPASEGTPPTQSVPSTGMEVYLSISNAPALNQTAELTCTITSISDAYNTTAQIVLPEGFELVSGNLSWNGDIIVPEEEKRKHPRPPLNGSGPEWEQLWEEYEYPTGKAEFSVITKSVEEGNWTIAATAGYDVFTQEGVRYGRLGDSDYVYLAVREDTAWISETLFTTEGPAPARQLNVTPPLPPVEPPTENITTPEPVKPPSVPSTGIEVNLSISSAPTLNEIAELTCSIASVSDAHNTTAQIILPEGFELVSGSLFWNGDIIVPEEEKRKHPRLPLNGSSPEWERLWEKYPKGGVEFGAVVKVVKVGNWTITATAGYDVFTQEGKRYGRLGDSDYVYLAVREDTAWISETLFTTEGPAPAHQLNVTPECPLFVDFHVTEKVITPVAVTPPPGYKKKLNRAVQPPVTPPKSMFVHSESKKLKNGTINHSTVRIQPNNLFDVRQNAFARSTVTILSEDFEGSFPSGNGWTVGDSDSDNGLDYWDDTSYRAWGGGWSGWCADIGVQTNEVVVFDEDFEGVFPGNWQVGDSQPDSGEDYWGDTSHRSYGGSWSCYCADISDVSGYEYDNMMYAYLIRAADASDWDSATLSYHTWYEIESSYDYLRVIVTGDGGAHWYEIGDKLDGSSGWDYHSVSIPAEYLTSNFGIGFLFYSDSIYTYEGAYVDDVSLTAIVTGPNSGFHQYDDDMEAHMQKQLDLTGYTDADLSYDYWLDVEDGYDYLKVQTSTGGSNWNNEKVYSDGYDSKDGDPYARTWYYDSVDLSAYTGSSVYIRFLFDSDGSVHDREGAYLDDIKVEAEVPGELAITGRWWCWVSENTFTGGVRADVEVPLVWGQVWIWDGNDNFLGGGLTEPDGTFDITVTNPGATGFYVEILPYSGVSHVTKEDGSEYSTYTTRLWYPLPSDTTCDIEDWMIFDAPDYRSAWRIYETIANDAYDRGAWDFLVNEGPGYTPPEVTVRFPADGTYYSTGSHEIHIEVESHTKALDVVQHEYGHFIMHMVYNLYWPITHCPSPHFINRFSHPNCAWTEGWANFFPIAVQDESNFEWGDGNDIDLEEPTWGTPNWDDGDGVEGRVAGALFDV